MWSKHSILHTLSADYILKVQVVIVLLLVYSIYFTCMYIEYSLDLCKCRPNDVFEEITLVNDFDKEVRVKKMARGAQLSLTKYCVCQIDVFEEITIPDSSNEGPSFCTLGETKNKLDGHLENESESLKDLGNTSTHNESDIVCPEESLQTSSRTHLDEHAVMEHSSVELTQDNCGDGHIVFCSPSHKQDLNVKGNAVEQDSKPCIPYSLSPQQSSPKMVIKWTRYSLLHA